MNNAELLVQHYQDTYLLTQQLWLQRNRIFLVLLGFVALSSILIFAPETHSILISWLSQTVGVNDPKKLSASVPFALLHASCLVVVFYLMVNLYHRASYVSRNYQYLGALEQEIRREMKIQNTDLSFTRESTFYWNKRSWVSGTVKYVYIIILGCLILTYLTGRIHTDWGNQFLIIVDFVIAIPTIGYYLAYSYYSIGFDKKI